MLNIEGTLRAYLNKVLSIPVYVSVPENPPERFATVERTGGYWESDIHEVSTVVVDYWGNSRADSWELADKGDTAVREFAFQDGIARIEPNSTCVHYPDIQSGRERYESNYDITTYI